MLSDIRRFSHDSITNPSLRIVNGAIFMKPSWSNTHGLVTSGWLGDGVVGGAAGVQG